uniref:C2H2-type domain-containing protein n=1 Tax=Peronospora matthiolae TaxID=2874970 RepID=A0AAV1T1A2_9STRA
MPAVCSSDGHLMNVLEHPQACGCTTSECDGLTCGMVVSKIAQDHSVEGHYTLEPASGTFVETQAAPKFHHSMRSSGMEHGCTPRRVHPRIDTSVVQDGKHAEARSTIRESIVEQARSNERELIEEDVTVIVPVTEENFGVPESNNFRESYIEDVDPQPPANVFSQEITESVNVLVNDGSSVGANKIDRVTPPKSASEVVKLPTLESKRFLRDLRSDKIKQICVLVTEKEGVADIRSSQVFAENERVLSSLSMDESVLDERPGLSDTRLNLGSL